MPLSALHACAQPGCYALVRGAPRCAAHDKRKAAIRVKVKNRFYDSASWRRYRRWFLNHHPLCEMDCKVQGIVTPANEVDHIRPIGEGGEPFNEQNCRAGCKPCHSRRTARDSGWSR